MTTTSPHPNLLGPLTTSWSAPTSCQSAWLACATCSSAWLGQTCLSRAYNQDDYDCWPPVTVAHTHTLPFDGLGFYSPGIACPSGYQTACAMQGATNGLQETVKGSQGFDFEYTPTLEETAVGCCPTGYACASHHGAQICSRQVASTTTPILSCDSSGGALVTTMIFPETITAISTASPSATMTVTGVSTITEFTIIAPLFQLNYRATDMPSSTSATFASAQTDAASISSSSSSSKESSTETSSGAIARTNHTNAIAVGVTIPIVVLALIAATTGWLFLRRKRKAKRPAEMYAEAGGLEQPAKPDLSPAESNGPVELSAQNALKEMPASSLAPMAELHGGSDIHELDGTVRAIDRRFHE